MNITKKVIANVVAAREIGVTKESENIAIMLKAIREDVVLMNCNNTNKEGDRFFSTSILETIVYNDYEYCGIILYIIFGFLVTWYINKMLCTIPSKVLFHRFFIIAFAMSVLCNYAKDYTTIKNKNYLILREGIPDHCDKTTATNGILTSIIFSFTKIIRSIFWISRPSDVEHVDGGTLTDEELTCLRYTTSLVLDPIWEVPPTAALSKTVLMLIIDPAKALSKAINEIIRHLVADIPFVFLPLYVMMIIVFFTIGIFAYKNYDIQIPYILNITSPKEGWKTKQQQITTTNDGQLYVEKIFDKKNEEEIKNLKKKIFCLESLYAKDVGIKKTKIQRRRNLSMTDIETLA